MRLVPIVLAVSLGLTGVACSSNNDLANSNDNTGGFQGFGTGGSFDTGGFGASSSGGFIGNGGVSSNGGALSFGGTGGTTSSGGTDGGKLVDGGGPDASSTDGGNADSGIIVTPVVCADPTEKRCIGSCVKPSPANGCSFSTCTSCPSVANGFPLCDQAKCSFECNPGYKTSGGGCVENVSADAGKGKGDNGSCSKNSDCTSKVCHAGTCQPATCSDKVQNGLESDVDCGGNCGPCTINQHCGSASDCDDGPCQNGVCGCTPHTCSDPSLAGRCGDTLADHCGGTTSCGCGSGDLCYQAACCDPQAACQTACGSVTACGQNVDCGLTGCSPGQTCDHSKCCTPLTQCPVGMCGTASDGCGGTIPCTGCTNGRVCSAAGQCACDGTDTDKDGLTDCAEADDGDPWTDPAIFNGLVGASYANCNAKPTCGAIDTNAEVDACMAKTVLETHDLISGWGFADTSATRCDASYSFTPDWTKSCGDYSFSVSYTGFINLKAGMNCFDIAGTNSDSCGVFFLDGSDVTPVTHDSGAKCFNVANAGGHQVRLFFDRAIELIFSPVMGFNWQQCFGGSSTCKPTTTVPQNMLRVSN